MYVYPYVSRVCTSKLACAHTYQVGLFSTEDAMSSLAKVVAAKASMHTTLDPLASVANIEAERPPI